MSDAAQISQCAWLGCDSPALPGKRVCERHASGNPKRFKPKPIPTIEAAQTLIASGSKAKRKKGMEMLCELHATEQILQHALAERDSGVLEIASEALDPNPPELVRHLLTQPSSWNASLYMRFHVARRNYLHAEETIRDVYSTRRTLTLDVIEGIGRAYLRSLSTTLNRRLSVPLELYEDALRAKGEKAVAGVDRTRYGEWSRDACSAIRSVVALTRLDAEFDVREAMRLLDEAERIQHELTRRQDYRVKERAIRDILGTRAYLEWILFDKGVRTTPESVHKLIKEGAIEVLPDLGTTLLKRGDDRFLTRIARELPLQYFIEAEFCFWPLMNWLEVAGVLPKGEYSKGHLEQFWRARESGVQPPPWWKWR
jgi:hypothetical protein